MGSAQRLGRSRTVSYPPTLSSVRELALDWTIPEEVLMERIGLNTAIEKHAMLFYTFYTKVIGLAANSKN